MCTISIVHGPFNRFQMTRDADYHTFQWGLSWLPESWNLKTRPMTCALGQKPPSPTQNSFILKKKTVYVYIYIYIYISKYLNIYIYRYKYNLYIPKYIDTCIHTLHYITLIHTYIHVYLHQGNYIGHHQKTASTIQNQWFWGYAWNPTDI